MSPANPPARGTRPFAFTALVVALGLGSFASGGARAEPGASPVTAAGNSIHADTLAALPSGAAAAPLTLAPPAAVGALPARSSADEPSPARYPAVRLAAGFGAYDLGSSGVGDAFHRIEDVHRAAGYTIRPASDVRSLPILLSTLTVTLAPPIAVAVQLGRTPGADNDVRLSGGLVSGRLAVPSNAPLTLEAGFGGGICGFHFTRHYGSVISPSGGTYTTLDRISLEGRRGYWTVNGGADYELMPRLVFEARVQYVGMTDVTLVTGQAGNVSLNLGGGVAGVALGYEF